MCWSKLKAKVKVNEEDYIKPAIFETEWNRWYILMILRGEAEMDEQCLAEEKASDEPREEYIRLLEKELKSCKALIRERDVHAHAAALPADTSYSRSAVLCVGSQQKICEIGI